MRISRGISGLALLVAGILAVARTGDGAPRAAPAPAGSELVGDAVAGKETFTEYCSICHGVGAKGFIGPNISGVNWTTAGLHAIVRAGVGGYGSMPAFNADAITDKNIADIAAYLAALPPASAAPVATTSAAPTSTAPPSSTTPAPASSTTSAPPALAVPVAGAVHGHAVYMANCAACHGANAQGGIGPSLRGEKNRKDTAAAIAWIKNPRPPMPKLYPVALSEKDVDDVAAYVESL